MVGGPAAALAVAGRSIVAATGYASLYDRELAAAFAATPFVLSGFLVPDAPFLTVSEGRRHQLDRRVSATVIVLFAAFQFYLGYRSTAAMPLIA